MIELPVIWLLTLLGAVAVSGGGGGGRVYVLRVAHEKGWTWISGDTYQLKNDLIKQLPVSFRWSGKRKAWYARELVDLGLIQEYAERLGPDKIVQVVDVAAGGEVRAFRPRAVEQKPQPQPGHRGQLVGGPGSGLPAMSAEDILGARGIRFGTSVPYHISSVGPAKKGFQDDRVVRAVIWAPQKDVHSGAITQMANSLVYKYAKHFGISFEAGVISAGVNSRARMMIDNNPSSASRGKKKRMVEAEFYRRVTHVPEPFVNPDTGEQVPNEYTWTWWPSQYSPTTYLPPWRQPELAQLGMVTSKESAPRAAASRAATPGQGRGVRATEGLDGRLAEVWIHGNAVTPDAFPNEYKMVEELLTSASGFLPASLQGLLEGGFLMKRSKDRSTGEVIYRQTVPLSGAVGAFELHPRGEYRFVYKDDGTVALQQKHRRWNAVVLLDDDGRFPKAIASWPLEELALILLLRAVKAAGYWGRDDFLTKEQADALGPKAAMMVPTYERVLRRYRSGDIAPEYFGLFREWV